MEENMNKLKSVGLAVGSVLGYVTIAVGFTMTICILWAVFFK
jgi:hypothetical protein